MALPASVYLVIGAIVTIVSYFIGDRFILFFFVGVAFLAIGVFGVLRSVLMQEPAKRYVCYRCRGEVRKGAVRCVHCHARLDPRHGM